MNCNSKTKKIINSAWCWENLTPCLKLRDYPEGLGLTKICLNCPMKDELFDNFVERVEEVLNNDNNFNVDWVPNVLQEL